MEAIASLYKLTASELRVLQAIVEVGGVPRGGGARHFREHSQNSSASRVRQDRPQRQVDLANLVAQHASPFADECPRLAHGCRRKP